MNLKEFIDPPRQYRLSPFWSWNGEMEPAEIETQIRDMQKKGFGGFFMHSGTGLKTKYMSDDWMKAIRRAIEVANELKTEAWLHDEDRYPSGFSGGKTTEGKEKNLPIALLWSEDASSLDKDILDKALAFTVKGANGKMKLIKEKPDELSGIGVFYEHIFTKGYPRYNGENYADLLNPEAVKFFLDNTHENYSKLFKYDFGKYMPGIFTDGPNVNRSMQYFENEDYTPFSFPWTTGFAKYFEKMHGYSPLDHLHHLINDSDDGFKFRHDFWLAVNELFLETFTIPISSWCREHDILFTGHYPHENEFFKMILSGGSVMAHYEYLNMPGVNNPGCGTNNPQSLKQVSSVSNQLGQNRVIGKIFGSSGYSLSFEDMKWIANFHNVLGINFLSPQYVKYSMLGDSKKDDPSTFSYHQPYWEKFRVINDYIARCSWAVSQGRDTASVLVIAPITSAYGSCNVNSTDGGEILQSIEHSYNKIIGELLAEHIAFDVGDERISCRHGSVSENILKVGNAEYKAVILPYSLTWKSSTLDLLGSFNGQVIIMGVIPARVDGALSERCSALLEKENVINIPDDPSNAVETIISRFGRNVSVTHDDGSEARTVFVNHRVEAAAHILFLANTERKERINITLTVNALGGVVELDPATGRAYRYNSEINDNQTVIKTALPPAGSKIFLVDQTQTSINTDIKSSIEEFLTIEGPYAFKKLNDNSLTLDRCSLETGGKTIMENVPVWKAKKTIWENTGIAEYWGYQHWVLKEKNVRSKTNKTALTFNFTVKDIPETISLAMETSDRFTIEINGTKIDFTPGRWYIDRRFRVLNLEDHIVEGINTIKAKTDFLWDTEIENIYIFGDFAVGPEEEGFPIIKEPETLNLGNWVTQGYPFYSGSITYKMEFTLDKDDSARYEIDLSSAAGSIFSVIVNEIEVGAIPFSPFRGDITDALKNGDNVVEIEVVGTLRNTLGPFHTKNDVKEEIIGPEQFYDETKLTDSYRFSPYGIIKPPKLVKIR